MGECHSVPFPAEGIYTVERTAEGWRGSHTQFPEVQCVESTQLGAYQRMSELLQVVAADEWAALQ